jgi:alpha-tubulin suppressor-like RCC1 family protein
METLSNHQYPLDKGGYRDVRIKKIACGKDHCMALMDLGVLTIWGDNEYGQIGNKKRSFT